MPEVEDRPIVETPVPQDTGVDLSKLTAAPDDLYSDLASAKKRDVEEKDRIYSSFAGGINRDIGRAERAYEDEKKAGADVKAIQKWDADAEAKKYSHDPLEKFGSLASVVGILASAFTHTPFENALNASASAMGAIQQRDDLAFDRAHEAWKENIDLAMKRHQIEHQSYTDALQLMTHNMAAGRALMEVQAARFGDKKMQFLLEAGMDDEVNKLIASRQKMALDLGKDVPRINEDWMKWKDLQTTVAEKMKQFPDDRSRAMNEAVREVQTRWADPNKMRGLTGVGGIVTPQRQQAIEIERRKQEYIAQGMDEKSAYEKAVKEVNVANFKPTAGVVDKTTARYNTVSHMEDAIGKVENLLVKHKFITGVGGSIGRPLEAASNVVFGSNETDRRQFERWVTEIKDWWRQLERVPGITLKGDAEDAAKIIAGLRPGDTVANTLRAYRELKPLLAKIKKEAITRRDAPFSVGTGQAEEKPVQNKMKPWEMAPKVE